MAPPNFATFQSSSNWCAYSTSSLGPYLVIVQPRNNNKDDDASNNQAPKQDKNKLNVKAPKKLWSKIIIYNVAIEIEKDEIYQAIETQLNFEPVESWCALSKKVNLKSKETNHWILEIHPKI